MTEQTTTPIVKSDGGQEGTAETTTTVAQDGDGSKEREDTLRHVEELVSFFREHPDWPLPYDFREGIYNVFVDNREEFAKLARSMGHAEKGAIDLWFVLRKNFGPLSLDLVIAREQVCQRIVTGTRTVPSRYEPEYVEEIVEWKCDDPLLTGVGE